MAPDSSVPSLLSGNPEEDERKVQHLLRTIAEVNSNRDLTSLLNSVVDRTLAHIGAERAVLMLVEGGKLRRRVARDFKGKDLPEDVSYSRSVPRDVAKSGRPQVHRHTTPEELTDLGTSIISLRLLTVMCVPLRYKDRMIGVLYVDSKATTREFSESDLVLLNALADQAAIAIENARLFDESLEKARIQHELRIAQTIQSRLLPAGSYPVDGFDVYGMSVPCDETGGDYFDYLDGRDGNLRVAVGDVVGHGVPAALFMTTARALLRAFSSSEPEIGLCTEKLNAQLERDMDPEQFMTLFLAELIPSEKTFHYVCAGHNPPILVRRSGEIEELERTGLGLGIMADAPYRVRGPVTLTEGDVLFIYTDGIPEARNLDGEQFEMERVYEVLLRCRKQGAREMASGIREAVTEWRGERERDDDETMVVLKAL